MSIKELKKGNLEEVSGSLSKYVINCQSKITENTSTTEGWLENISYIHTLRNSGSLISPDRTNKQILEGILNGKEKVVVKVSNISENIDKEYTIYEILIDNNIIGILDYYCFFICKDFLKRIREELTDKIDDYGRIIYKPNFNKKTNSICRKDGNDMKVLIMKYAEDGSFGLYNWKSNDIDKVKSCIKQVICSLVDAYIKVGFVHFDLNNNNYVLIKTTKKEIKYLINGKEIIVKIPKNGFETAIMDLEDCEINQNIYKFIKCLDKLFSRIKDIISIEKEWNQYAINIDSKMIELRELSINDNSKNDKLAMRVLEILDIL